MFDRQRVCGWVGDFTPSSNSIFGIDFVMKQQHRPPFIRSSYIRIAQGLDSTQFKHQKLGSY